MALILIATKYVEAWCCCVKAVIAAAEKQVELLLSTAQNKGVNLMVQTLAAHLHDGTEPQVSTIALVMLGASAPEAKHVTMLPSTNYPGQEQTP